MLLEDTRSLPNPLVRSDVGTDELIDFEMSIRAWLLVDPGLYVITREYRPRGWKYSTFIRSRYECELYNILVGDFYEDGQLGQTEMLSALLSQLQQ